VVLRPESAPGATLPAISAWCQRDASAVSPPTADAGPRWDAGVARSV